MADAQANALRERYPVEDVTAWGRIILSSIGAVIIGLGVILFFAYNWADMHKFLKLAVVLGSVALAHGAGLYFSRQVSTNDSLKEGCYLLGTMLFGSGIWLVSQIYHIDDHYPNGIFAWGIGALLLAWAAPSVIQGLMAVVLITAWAMIEIIDFQQAHLEGVLLVLFGIVPLAWLQRSRPLLLMALIAFGTLYTFYTFNVADMLDVVYANRTAYFLAFYSLFALVCMSVVLSNLVYLTRFPESRRVIAFVGYAAYLTLLYALSYQDIPKELLKGFVLSGSIHWLCFLVPLAAVLCVSGVYVYTRTWRHLRGFENAALTLVGLSLTLLLITAFMSGGHWYALRGTMYWAFSLIFISHAILFILGGTKQVDWKKTTLGCLMFVAIVVPHFLELFDSLLIRSLVFLLVGIGVFAVGNFYSRNKLALEEV